MIETYKLLTHKYDNRNGLPLLQLDLNDRTRGNDMKLAKNHVRYDMRKYFFTCRIINLWNSLPAHVVEVLPLSMILKTNWMLIRLRKK